MKPPRVWFNKHLSNTFEALALLAEARGAGEFRIVCSHPRASYGCPCPQPAWCDHFEQEPIGLDDDAYVQFCLDFVRRHEVAVFFPGRKALPIMQAAVRFRDLGVQVVAAGNAATLALASSKARVYHASADANVRVPHFEIVNDLAGFDAAWTRLRRRHRRLCYKPDTSVFGIGFHIVVEHGTPPHPRGVHIALAEARERLARTPRFRDLMLMQYLPGPERSVDCLARHGELLRCVVRRKMAGGQVIEDHPEIEAAARDLARRLGLNNLFNVQFRDAGGKPYLLEINPRMSGGLPFACEAGIVLPLWAIRLALGSATVDDIPWPRTGVWVTQPEAVTSL